MKAQIAALLLLVSSATALISVCAPDENLLAFLKALPHTASYPKLNAANQLLLTNIFAEVQVCQLTAYVNTVGFTHILTLLDKLTPQEAHILNGYIVKHLNIEAALAHRLHHSTTRHVHHTTH